VNIVAYLDVDKNDRDDARSSVHLVDGDHSVDSTIAGLEQTHLSAPSNGSNTSNNCSTQDQPILETATIDTVTAKPELTASHEKKMEVVKQETPKLKAGPKHYGSPMQKQSPCEKVIAALLDWKTPKTDKFLSGTEPDLNQLDEPVSDIVQQMSACRMAALLE